MSDLSGPVQLAGRLRKADKKSSAQYVIMSAVILHHLPKIASQTFELLRLARNSGSNVEDGLDNLIKPRKAKSKRRA